MVLSGKFSIGSIAVAEARGLALLQMCGQRALQCGGHGFYCVFRIGMRRRGGEEEFVVCGGRMGR
jgi:hypothetical protein